MVPDAESRAYIPMSGEPFSETLDFFVDELGMRLHHISPADDPSVAIVQGHGITLRMDKATSHTPAVVLETGCAPSTTAPNGVEVHFVDPVAEADLVVPDLQPDLVITNNSSGNDWVTGRAGMRYRDLIPSRLGGRYIASHIEVCDGGPVPDLVHHHAIRFQMIFCHRGWVEVIYEDQGGSFFLQAGDCVLQPPHIRHRVLSSSAGARVVEIGCPAEHDTFFDYDLELPTAEVWPGRLFGDQTFVRHQAAETEWELSSHPGFTVQHTGIEAATNGLASVRVLKASGQGRIAPQVQPSEFWFLFVLEGSVGFAIDRATASAPLAEGDSVTIPPGVMWSLRDGSADLRLLEVVVH